MKATIFSVLLAMLVALAPADLHASGAYGTRFVGQDFGLTFQSRVRKRFVDAEQGRRYMASWDGRYYSHLNRALPAVTRLLNKARKRGLGIGKLRLELMALRLVDVAEAGRIDRRSYPVNVEISLTDDDPFIQRVELTLVRPINRSALKRLRVGLAKELAWTGDGGAGGKALPARRAAAACRFDGGFGLYVGPLAKTTRQAQAAMTRRFEDELARIGPRLKERFAAPGAWRELGVDKLQAVEPAARARKAGDICQTFNPWGPLVDDGPPALVRTDIRVGAIQIIAMISPTKYNWGKVNRTLQRWLDAVAGRLHNRIIAQQGRYLVLSRRGDRHRWDVLRQMADSREPRFIKLLGSMILDPKSASSVRTEAAEILARIDQPKRHRTFIAVLSNRREKDNSVRKVAASALANHGGRAVVKLLARIANDESADWNLRTACRKSLATIKARGKDRRSP